MSGSSGLRHLVPEPQLRDLEITVGLHNKADGLVPGFVLGVHRVNITLTVPELWWAESEFTLADRWPEGPSRVRVVRAVTNPSGLASTLYPAGSGNLNLPDVPEPSTSPSGIGVRVASGGAMHKNRC